MKGTSIDAVLFTVVKLMTSFIAMIGIKIVSVNFSIQQYGTYGQALLIISTMTAIIILGMTDGVNYSFNNSSISPDQRIKSVSTLFSLQTIVGIVGGISILLCGSLFTEYFKNPALGAVYIWIAFQPLVSNYQPMLQCIYISIGKSKLIVLRNLILSLFRLGVFIIASYVTKSIVTILAACFLFDLFQAVYFWLLLRKYRVNISFKLFDYKLIKPILQYCIPIAVFVVLNTLLRDIDKWVVGYLGNTNEVAIYTNCSRVLPFDMLTGSFAMVLSPIITRNIGVNNDKVYSIFGNYLNLSLFTTSILVLPAILLSKDLLLTLYDPDFLPGLKIFIIYLCVDLLRFANLAILFSASGKSTTLMIIASICLIINTILAILLYKLVGFAGPAFATLITIILSVYLMLRGGGKIIGNNIFKSLDIKTFTIIIIEVLIIAIILFQIKQFTVNLNPILCFFLYYIPIIGVLLILNKKPVLNLVRVLNNVK